MRLFLAIVFWTLLVFGETGPSASAQPVSSGDAWQVELEGGLSSLKTGAFRDVYLETLVQNRQRYAEPFGAPGSTDGDPTVRPQTDFPAHVAFGATVLRTIRRPSLQVGLSARHTRTNAYARYADPNGSVAVDAALRTTFFYVTGRYAFVDVAFGTLTPYVQLDVGLAHVNAQLSDRTEIQRFSGVFESARSDSGTGWTPVVAAHAGATYPIGPAYLTARGGYRLGRANDVFIRPVTTQDASVFDPVISDVNVSGWVALVGVGYSF